MSLRQSKFYKILFSPERYLFNFRKRPSDAIFQVFLFEALAIFYVVSQLPPLIHYTLAIEIMRSIIQVNGVLIGFVGLMMTVLFTRPPYKGRIFLQRVLRSSIESVGLFLFSILSSVFLIAFMKFESGLSSGDLVYPMISLVTGVSDLFIFIGYVSGAIPTVEQEKTQTSI